MSRAVQYVTRNDNLIEQTDKEVGVARKFLFCSFIPVDFITAGGI